MNKKFAVSWYYTIEEIEYIFHEEPVSYEDMKDRLDKVFKDCGENFDGFNVYKTKEKEYSLVRKISERWTNPVY